MKVVAILGKRTFGTDSEFIRLADGIRSAGHELTVLGDDDVLPADAGMILSVGGDGTYLGASKIAALNGVPILGVNFGRLGFLSENTVDTTLQAFREGKFVQKTRVMLNAVASTGEEYIALNEIVARRTGPAMLGVRLTVNGRELPTYWGDGLIIATSAGSTAYNMSAGGPIVLPSSKVFIITPIAPHNLNMRPLVIPNDSRISMEFLSRDQMVDLSADNQSVLVPCNTTVAVSMAQFSLKRMCLGDSSFIQALSDKLFWGEDKRNER